MDSIETRQRIAYLIEHGGVWEQAIDRNDRTHNRIFLALAGLFLLQLAELLIAHLL